MNAIEVRGVSKSFRVPTSPAPGLAERIRHPRRRTPTKQLRVLEEVSFDVAQGEFLGVLGRNGSGKSTLLKLIASIYRADRGSIGVRGRLAPFIELGVGFNHELTARDNIVLNGVMMGLSASEARRRHDRILDFAGLREFEGLRLKNYSAGMHVRLAFAVMLEVDADVLLFDEVLAVGDASFQERSSNALAELRARGLTVILVTHSMAHVELLCSRAMMLRGGHIAADGEPSEVANLYLRESFEAAPAGPGDDAAAPAVRFAGGAAIGGLEVRGGPTLEVGDELALEVDVEALEDIEEAALALELMTVSGVRVFCPQAEPVPGANGGLRRGESRRLRWRIENRLTEGHYQARVGLVRHGRDGEIIVLSELRHADFEITGSGRWTHAGLVVLDHGLEAGERAGADR